MNDLWFSWADLRQATGGDWLGTGPADRAAAGVSAVLDDSRAVTPGALFVAIRGETADGHRFVEQAAAAGAAAVCVSQAPADDVLARLGGLGCAVLRVPDTLAAFQQLAHRHRRSLPALLLVGITGSCGKTSTKEMLAAVLERRYPGAVLKTEGNTNNHFGVPRNLLRLAGGSGPQSSRWAATILARSAPWHVWPNRTSAWSRTSAQRTWSSSATSPAWRQRRANCWR
jgi:UDP-N-acetylmuramyl pentapeptide synthase